MSIDRDKASQMARALWKEGHDCAGTMVRVFAQLGVVKDVDLDTMYLLASAFGNGGGGRLCDCGALSGALLVISSVVAPQAKKQKEVYRATARFTKQFVDEFGATNCRVLLKERKVNCREHTCATARLLAEYLNNEVN